MIDKNPQALSLAFKKCKGKKLKIKELEITPDMDENKAEALIEILAEKKAVEDGTEVSEHIKGQRWYVEGLIKFSALSSEEQLESEYQEAFAENASEAEMLDSLRSME